MCGSVCGLVCILLCDPRMQLCVYVSRMYGLHHMCGPATYGL